jgi:hypothetical protein
MVEETSEKISTPIIFYLINNIKIQSKYYQLNIFFNNIITSLELNRQNQS